MELMVTQRMMPTFTFAWSSMSVLLFSPLQECSWETGCYPGAYSRLNRIFMGTSTFEHWHGHEVDTQGDAFFVVFARACPGYLNYPFQNKHFGHGSCAHFSYLQRLIFSKTLVF